MTKIKVRELAIRLTEVRGVHMSPADVVALAEAAGVLVTAASSLTKDHVFVMLGQTELDRRAWLMPLMGEEWPPPPRSRREFTSNIRSVPPRPIPAARKPACRDDRLNPVMPPPSEASRQAAAAARPAPPPRPLTATPFPPARQRKRGNSPRPSVKVADLPGLTRAILPRQLRSRHRIGQDEASRWNAEGERWGRAGFNDRTVLPWLDTELWPEDAAYLAARGVQPNVLTKLVPVPFTVVATGSATVDLLLNSRRMPVEAVYDAIVQARHHTPPPEPELILAEPARPVVDRPAPPPAVFSNPGDVDDHERPVKSSPRRRHPSRGRQHRHRPGGNSAA